MDSYGSVRVQIDKLVPTSEKHMADRLRGGLHGKPGATNFEGSPLSLKYHKKGDTGPQGPQGLSGSGGGSADLPTVSLLDGSQKMAGDLDIILKRCLT